MQLLADFNIASETEDTDTDEDLSNPTHTVADLSIPTLGITSPAALGIPLADSD